MLVKEWLTEARAESFHSTGTEAQRVHPGQALPAWAWHPEQHPVLGKAIQNNPAFPPGPFGVSIACFLVFGAV